MAPESEPARRPAPLDHAEHRQRQHLREVFDRAHAMVEHFEQVGQHAAQQNARDQRHQDGQRHGLRERRLERRDCRGEHRNIGLGRLALEAGLVEPVVDRIVGLACRLHVAHEEPNLVALFLELQDFLLLRLDRGHEVRLLDRADGAGGGISGGDVARLLLEPVFQLGEFRLHAQVLRVILAQVARGLLQPAFPLDDVGSERRDDRILHHLRQGVRGAGPRTLLAPRVRGLPLGRGEPRGKVVQLDGFVVQVLRGRNDAFLLLVFGKPGLGFLEVLPQHLGLVPEPAGILPCRLDLQLDRGLDIGLRVGIGNGSDELRVRAGVGDVEEVAVARGHDLEVSLQQLDEPVVELAPAAGALVPLLFHRPVLVELQYFDDLPRHAVALDDVQLRAHVAGDHHRRQQHGGNRVGRLDVHHDGGLGEIFLGQQQARGYRGRDSRQRRRKHDDITRPKNAQNLQRVHRTSLRTGSR